MPVYEKAVESLRRLGAKVHATNITASGLLRCYHSRAGYDLIKAGGGLIGLSKFLADDNPEGIRALSINEVQVGMKLPRDYNDERLRWVKEILHPRP